MFSWLSLGAFAEPGTQALDTPENLSKLRAMDLFPAVEVEGSALHKAVAEEILRLEIRSPQIFKDPDWPVKITRRIAARLGIAPRPFTEIYNDQTKQFRLSWADDPYFHDVVIHRAKYGVSSRMFDVTELVADAMSANGVKIDVGDHLLPGHLEEAAGARRERESDAAFWARQREAMSSGEISASKEPRVLRVTYECRGEKKTISAQQGEILEITSEYARASTAEVPENQSSKPNAKKKSSRKEN